MIKYTNECIGCPPEMGCLHNACPNLNVRRIYCDICGDYAMYHIDEDGDKDYCENCAMDFVFDFCRSQTFQEIAKMLEIDYEVYE